MGRTDYNDNVSDTGLIMQHYVETDGEIIFDYLNDYDEPSYVQSVLDASTIDETNHYVLSNANLVKLLHDHGASYSEWKEDCTRYNDPLEMLTWLGY